MATKKRMIEIEKPKKGKTTTSGTKKKAIEIKKTTKPTSAAKKKPGVSVPVKVVKTTKPAKKKKRIAAKIINFFLSLFMLLGIGIMCLIIVFFGYIVINAPEFDTDKLYSKEASIFYDKNGTEIMRVGDQQRDLVTYDELPEVLIDAIVATEDARFFQHNGFDIVRFMKATLGQVTGQ